MAGASVGTTVYTIYLDDVLKGDVSVTTIPSSCIPQLTGVGKTFIGWFDINGTQAVENGYWDSLARPNNTIYLYSKWEYDTVAIDGQILRDIANAIRKKTGLNHATDIKVTEMASLINSL